MEESTFSGESDNLLWLEEEDRLVFSAGTLVKGTPADPDVFAPGQYQWHLVGTWGLHADQVWTDYTGSGVRIGAVDDGFEYSHSEFSNYRTDLDYDTLGNDSDAAPGQASDRHGTSVMGTMIADDNGIGTVGVAFDAYGVGIRQGFGASSSLADTVEAFQHALAVDVDVLNNSWGYSSPFVDDNSIEFSGTDFYTVRDTLIDMVGQGRDGLGMNVVFSAGNDRSAGDNVNYHNMHNSPYTIAVGAIDSDGTYSSFSTPGAAILTSAGGTMVYTTDRAGANGYSSGDYTNFSGTSASAPIVSGMIGLLLEANPDLGWRDVQEIIAYSSQHNDAASAGWQYNGAQNWNGGGLHYSHDYGFGAADAWAAIRLAETWNIQQTSANMVTTAAFSAAPSLSIPATGTVQTTINVGTDIEIEHVIVHMDIDHAKAGDLVVTLISPDGTESVLVNRPENGAFTTSALGLSGIDFEMMSVAHWGESSAGAWTLKISDMAASNSGILRDWSLQFMGNNHSADDTYYYNDEYINITDYTAVSSTIRIANADLSDTDGGVDTLNFSMMHGTGDVVCRLDADDPNFMVNWRNPDPNSYAVQNVFANGTVIENVITGDGNDLIYGNAANNYLYGGRGNDSLYLDGVEYDMTRGGGDDIADGAQGSDTVIYSLHASSEFDFTFVNASTVLARCTTDNLGTDTLKNIENFHFSDGVYTMSQLQNLGSGGGSNPSGTISIFFSDGQDLFQYDSDSDENSVLTGADINFGTAGTSYVQIVRTGSNFTLTYLDPAAPDTVTLTGSADAETITIAGTRPGLTANVMGGQGDDIISIQMAVAMSAYGGDGNDRITGHGGADLLYGDSGDDILNGGANSDILTGGTGNDTYIIESAGDVVVENIGEGIDTVRSAVTHTLGANIENLVLTGILAINGTGNQLDNTITGNAAVNTINGGLGADTMIGGLGNDTYIVDNAGDTVVEDNNAGTDIVLASADHELDANVENLTLTGTGNINGTGNASVNIITGNTGNNILDGGAGADRLVGGAGNDTYIVDMSTDRVTELAGAGTDVVRAGITYVLAANVENLVLTGSGNINGTGNTLGNVITGNDGNNVLNGAGGADTLVGGLGNDTYILNVGNTITENAGEGSDTIQTSASYILNVANVENVTLTGTAAINATGDRWDNILTGNSGINILTGGEGNDTLIGNAGADTLIGGLGDDLYVIDIATDILVENAGEGTDTVQSKITYTLGANIENLVLTGTTAISGTGNTLNNRLTGNGGTNTLDGGAGADTLIGGLGNDIYIVDNAGDTVTEDAAAGTDTIRSWISYTLAANLENLTIIGAAAVNATGNGLNNILAGNAANNILDGGAGIDKMLGGAGNDIYIVDNAADIVSETSGAGTDTVLSSITYTLAANIENLTLSGAADINATGNTLNNVLNGNSGDNVLNGKTGVDTMAGGAGNDTYIVDNVGDIVTEAANSGTDLVQSSVSYTLGADIENLTLTGTLVINGTGNILDNVMNGNSAANIIDGGAGADTMAGGAGNDTYIVDNGGDTVVENAAAGIDQVKSSTDYTLGNNVENLTLMGTDDINGTGNTLANIVNGNAGQNTLSGGDGNDTLYGFDGDDILMGGAGLDTLTGGNGADTFGFTSLAGGADVIRDFSIAQGDTLNITDLLTGFIPGVSDISQFVRKTQTTTGAQFAIDNDGGGNSFVQGFMLSGVNLSTQSVQDLLNGGILVVS